MATCIYCNKTYEEIGVPDFSLDHSPSDCIAFQIKQAIVVERVRISDAIANIRIGSSADRNGDYAEVIDLVTLKNDIARAVDNE